MSSSAIPADVTVETLCNYIKGLDGQRTFRDVDNNALLIPVENNFNPLNTFLQ